MASLGHIAIGLSSARVYHRTPNRSPRLVISMVLLVSLSMLPDADVVGFFFGIAYGDPFGHRGATHSFCFALLVGLLAGGLTKDRGFGLITALVVASHGVLDAMTDGGLGAGLFWPLSNQRYFLPWRPIPVAPIGPAIFSRWGLSVMFTELLYFVPLWIYAFWPRAPRTVKDSALPTP